METVSGEEMELAKYQMNEAARRIDDYRIAQAIQNLERAIKWLKTYDERKDRDD